MGSWKHQNRIYHQLHIIDKESFPKTLGAITLSFCTLPSAPRSVELNHPGRVGLRDLASNGEEGTEENTALFQKNRRSSKQRPAKKFVPHNRTPHVAR